jgi:hypothetical protein
MRLAVCLHGLARGSTVSAAGAYEQKFKTLLDFFLPWGADVFIHSWDEDIKDELNGIFRPLKFVYEPQRDFKEELKQYENVNFGPTYGVGANQGDIFKTLSFLYSRKQSLLMKKEMEEKYELPYNAVLICRFDAGHHNDGNNKTSHLPKHLPLQDVSRINQAYWNQTNAGASDHWFITETNESDYLGELYDKLPEYLHPDSEYNKACREGWPLSCGNDQFSGEIFKETKSEILSKYSREDSVLVNNHCLYKWHLMQANKWNANDCKFWNEDLWT